MYDEPLSDSSPSRCLTLTLLQPDACHVNSSVSVTSSAFIVVQSFPVIYPTSDTVFIAGGEAQT